VWRRRVGIFLPFLQEQKEPAAKELTRLLLRLLSALSLSLFVAVFFAGFSPSLLSSSRISYLFKIEVCTRDT